MSMLPQSVDYFLEDEQSDNYLIMPARTFRLDTVNKRIIGIIDDREAVMQFIKKVLSTDKYAYEVYDWYYGNDLKKLIGKPYDYICTEIPRIIEEALLVDDRIKSIGNYQFSHVGSDGVDASFLVDTIYGQVSYRVEVPAA